MICGYAVRVVNGERRRRIVFLQLTSLFSEMRGNKEK